jgi:hypothetical protein
MFLINTVLNTRNYEDHKKRINFIAHRHSFRQGSKWKPSNAERVAAKLKYSVGGLFKRPQLQTYPVSCIYVLKTTIVWQISAAAKNATGRDEGCEASLWIRALCSRPTAVTLGPCSFGGQWCHIKARTYVGMKHWFLNRVPEFQNKQQFLWPIGQRFDKEKVGKQYVY